MPLYGLKGRDNISTYRTKEVGILAIMEDQEPCRVLNGTAVRIRQEPHLKYSEMTNSL